MKERGPDRREKARRKKKSELLPNQRENEERRDSKDRRDK